MTRGGTLIGAALITMIAAMPGRAAETRGLGAVIAEIDQRFVCPEFLPDAEARRSELLIFSRALGSVGPRRITYRQASYIRAKLLKRHNCSNGVASVAPSARSAPTPPAAMASAAR